MARSRKKPIHKDVGFAKKTYHRTIRSTVNKAIREIAKLDDLEEIEIPDGKTIINDWDYSDYTIDLREEDDEDKWKKKISRK